MTGSIAQDASNKDRNAHPCQLRLSIEDPLLHGAPSHLGFDMACHIKV